MSPALDSALPLPRPARDPGVVPVAEGGLARTAPADDRPRLLTGARSQLRYTGRDGVLEVRAGSALLTGAIRVEGAAVADRVTGTPRTLTRRAAADGGELDAVVIVPERLPGAALQWVARGEVGPLRLEVELPRPAGSMLRTARDGALLRWAGDSGPSGAVLQLAGAVEGGWELAESEGRTLARATLRPAADRPATLLISAVDETGRLPSLAALAALEAHRRRDRLEPDEAEGVVLRTARPQLDRGVAWARAALRSRLDEAGDTPAVRGADLAVLLQGALAAGEREVAAAVLRALTPSTAADAGALALAPAWLERVPELLAHRPVLDRLAAAAPEALRRQLADAAEAMGEQGWATELRRPPAATGGRRLPTVGAAPPPPQPHEPPPSAAPAPPPDLPESPGADDLRTALATARGEGIEWSIAVLERALERLEAGAVDPEGAEPALALDLLVRGVLGVVPDAGYGRIEIAPALPVEWGLVTVTGIALGDARVGFRIRQESHRVEIALHQTAGGAPVTWILSPRLVAREITAVRVDGQSAEIDSWRVGTRIQPRLQLPAERERIVEMEVSPP